MPACVICSTVFTGRGRSVRCEQCVEDRVCAECKRPGTTTGRSPKCNGCWARPHVCTQCGREFTGNKSLCNPCRVAKDRTKRAENWKRWSEATGWKDKSKWAHIARKYGMTPEDFAAMLGEQDGRCAVCKSGDPGGRGTWHVDHDHNCCPTDLTCGRCIRGLLCYRCNSAIGNAHDDPALLRALAEYVERGPRK